MTEETTLGEFTEEKNISGWHELRLEELLSEMLTGGRPTGGGLDEGEYISIGGTQVDSEGYLNFHDLVYIPEDYFEQVEETRLKKHDILVVKDGANTGDVAIAWEDDNRVVTNEHLFTLRAGSDINSPYLFYFLLSHRGWKQIHGTITGSAQEGINRGFASKVDIEYPPLEQQRKIATILYNVDQAIQKTEEIIEQVNTVKSGVVQHVFREGVQEHESFSETKSGKVPSEWGVSRFEEVIEDTRYGTDTKSNTNGNGYPTLRIPNVVEKRITVDDLKYTPLDDKEVERLKLRENDILVLRTNGNPDYVGRCATFSEREEPFVFASYLIRVRVDESTVRPEYIREFLNSPRGRSEMAGWIRSSAGNYNLSVGAMEKFQVPIPSLKEQDEIVEKIEATERIIEANRQYRSRLGRLKRGLMQDLLSGTVRTTDTNIEVPDEIEQHG